MLKLLFFVIILGVIVKGFWFLNDLNKEQTLSSANIKIEKLSISKENNSSENKFFTRSLWKLTLADQLSEDEEINEIDTNSTITIINKKNSKQICKGKKCITIKGFLSTTLLLDDGNQTILLKPTQIIFDELKFIRYTDTKLYFENNQSGEEYELEFFSYKQPLDSNDTETKKDTK